MAGARSASGGAGEARVSAAAPRAAVGGLFRGEEAGLGGLGPGTASLAWPPPSSLLAALGPRPSPALWPHSPAAPTPDTTHPPSALRRSALPRPPAFPDPASRVTPPPPPLPPALG